MSHHGSILTATAPEFLNFDFDADTDQPFGFDGNSDPALTLIRFRSGFPKCLESHADSDPDPQHNSKSVLLIRVGFHADPDPAFFINADPDPDPSSDFTVTKSCIFT